MEGDSGWDEEFVLEIAREIDRIMDDDDLLDENDNYKYEKTKIEQPVDSTSSDLGIDKKLCDDVQIKSEVKCESDTQNQVALRKRQTTLSEYFAVIQPEAPAKLAPDNTSEKLINVSLLLNQLLTARVVINRLPDNKIVKTEPASNLHRKVGVQRYCQSCKTLNVDSTNLTMQKNCSKCDTMLLYVCDKCNEKRYRIYKSLRRHTIRCSTGTETENSSHIPRHCKIRQPLGKFMCKHCLFRTDYKNNLKRHFDKYHME